MDELQAALKAMGATLPEAAPPAPEPEEQPAGPIPTVIVGSESPEAANPADPAEPAATADLTAPPTAEQYNALAGEVRSLRAQVQSLQEMYELFLDTYAVQLEQENQRLRREVARLYALRNAGLDASAPAVPMPGYDAVSELAAAIPPAPGAADPEAAADPAPPMPPQAAAAPAPPKPAAPRLDRARYGDKGYIVVKEWGRSPKDLEGLDASTVVGPVATLKGMVCEVPRALPEHELEALVRQMHREFSDYDNLNIELFDDAGAARDFAETGTPDPAHRVAAISKLAATGRDVIVRFRDGAPIDVPPAP